MIRILRAAAAAFLLLAVGGCVSFWRGHSDPPRPPGIIYSPNGEPLSGGPLGDPTCEQALGRWFDRLDPAHKGTITLVAFLRDADRQFTVMDLDRSGVLTPSVLAQYRQPYFPDPAAHQHGDDSDAGDDEGRHGSSDRVTIADQVDPVMLADVDLSNKVTREQFLAYARQNFASFDADGKGVIDRDELLATCKE